MKTLKSILAISVIAAAQASGAVIPGLFNTGVDALGNVLPDGTLGDLHYKLASVPGGVNAVGVRSSAGGYPVSPNGPWEADNTLSAWIGPDNGPLASGPQGNYTYKTTFDLTGYNPLTAVIQGLWATDDVGVDIKINGVSISPLLASYTFQSFTITSGFLPGINTLDFELFNAVGPTALRVEMRSDVSPVPEPSTYFAGLSALGMLGLFGWRNRK